MVDFEKNGLYTVCSDLKAAIWKPVLSQLFFAGLE